MHHSISVRPACADDEQFLFRLFCSAHESQFASLDLPAEQMEQLLRMQFAARQNQYHDQYPNAEFDLVLNDGVSIGNLYAQRGPDEFVLIDITLLADYRNAGIGRRLIEDLVAEALAANKSLHAHVLKSNPAWRLWQRLGFRLVNDDGVYMRIEVPSGKIRKS